MKSKLKDLISRIKASISGERSSLDVDEILNPPSWRERQVRNQAIEKGYEESLMAKKPCWTDKYDKGFDRVNKEVIHVRERVVNKNN